MKRLISIIIILFSSYAHAATYYVDKDSVGGTCNNANAGTAIGAPWCTLAKSATTAVAGDLVYVRTGTYDETLSPSNSGTNGNEITWKPYNNEAVSINKTNGSSISTNQSYLIFEDFSMYPANPTGTPKNVFVVYNSGSNNEFRGFTIDGDDPEGERGQAIWITGIATEGGDDNLFEDNTITETSNHGITLNDNGANPGLRNIIRNNYISGQYGNCISSASELETVQGTLIEGNTLMNSIVSDGIQFNGNYVYQNTANHGTIIRNNIISGHAENGIDLKGTMYMLVENNYIHGGTGNNNGFQDEVNDMFGGFGGVTRGSNQYSSRVTIRGNVIYDNMGGLVCFLNFNAYHNTFIYNNRNYAGPGQTGSNTFMGTQKENNSVKLFNNIYVNNYYQVGADDVGLYIDYNWYYMPVGNSQFSNLGAGSYTLAQWRTLLTGFGMTNPEANSVESDPQLAATNTYSPTLAPSNYDFTPLAGSPVIDAARPITYVNGTTGTVTTCVVDDGWILSDGMGVVDGDTIMIGTDEVVLTDVNNTTLTWTGAVTIANNDPVYWCPQGTCYYDNGPDIGAKEYVGGDPPDPPDPPTDTVIYKLDTNGSDFDDTGTDYDLNGNNTPTHASSAFDVEYADSPIKSYTRNGTVFDDATQLTIVGRITLESTTAYYMHIVGRMDDTNGLGWGVAYNPYQPGLTAGLGYNTGISAEWHQHTYSVPLATSVWFIVKIDDIADTINIGVRDTLGTVLGTDYNAAILTGLTWNNSETSLSVGAWFDNSVIEPNHVFDGLIEHIEIHPSILTETQFQTIIATYPGGVDTEDPVVTISTAGGVVESGTTTYQVAYTASDDTAVTECKWRIGSAPDDSNGTVDAASPADFTGLQQYTNQLYVGCTDAAGNWGSDYISVYVGRPWAVSAPGTAITVGAGTAITTTQPQ